MIRLRKIAYVTVVAVLALRCASRSAFDCPDLRSLERQTELRTFRYSNGAVSASGHGLPSNWDNEYEMDSIERREVPAIRTGNWQYFYADGTKKAAVTYALACYIQCCTPGPCPQIHDYPVGNFEVWYPSGRKLAEGSFVAITRHVDTSCEGGDDTKAGRLSPDSRFWREDGRPMSVEEARATGYLFAGW
jgi:hypothetical protein